WAPPDSARSRRRHNPRRRGLRTTNVIGSSGLRGDAGLAGERWVDAGPAAEGAKEAVRVFVAEQVGDLGRWELGAMQVMALQVSEGGGPGRRVARFFLSAAAVQGS